MKRKVLLCAIGLAVASNDARRDTFTYYEEGDVEADPFLRDRARIVVSPTSGSAQIN
jgi:hypothetical protein